MSAPTTSWHNCCVRSYLAYARVTAAVATRLRLTSVEAAALQYLIDTDVAAASELGHMLGTSAGGTAALVQRLEGHGLLARLPNPEDPHLPLLTASPAGRRRWSQCAGPTIRALEELIHARPPKERAAATRFLHALTQSLEVERDTHCDQAG